MAQQQNKKKKIDWSMAFPTMVTIGISQSLFWFYINRLCTRIFTSAALIDQDVIGAAAPFSYNWIARAFVGAALFAFPILIIDGFEKKPSKWSWLIACLLAIPQFHGKTCLYEDGRMVTSMPLGIVRCEHTLSEVTLAEIEISGRSSSRAGHRGTRVSFAADMIMTLHVPCGNGEDIFTFSIESFRGEEENDQLIQMVRVRRQLPSSVIAIEPYSQRELQQMMEDEELRNANPSLIHELLAPAQQEESA